MTPSAHMNTPMPMRLRIRKRPTITPKYSAASHRRRTAFAMQMPPHGIRPVAGPQCLRLF